MMNVSYRNEQQGNLQDFFVDQTDRTLVNNALTFSFDPDGYRKQKPLEKDIYHTDPYITCSYCNQLTFVDVTVIQRMLSMPKSLSLELGLKSEPLAPCSTCGSVDCFVVGVQDFSKEISERKRKAQEKFERETAAAALIQQRYRSYLQKMYGSALSNVFLADRFYKFRAALRITCLARGRLARRRAKTERALITIGNSHPLLIRHALKSTPGRPATRVFWYKRKVEVDLVFRNYLELVEKTGFQPPRMVVENNIQELSVRIIMRKAELLILLQRRWRGFMARRIVKFFRTEIARIFQFTVSRAIKIQRAYRGHLARLLIPTLQHERRREKLMADYLGQGGDEQTAKVLRHQAETVKAAYVKERAEEFTCRATSKIDAPNEHGGNKMEAFWSSCYSDSRLDGRIGTMLETAQQQLDNRALLVEMDHDRKAFILDRIAEYGPTGFGLRSVSKTVVEQILLDKRQEEQQRLFEARQQVLLSAELAALAAPKSALDRWNKPAKAATLPSSELKLSDIVVDGTFDKMHITAQDVADKQLQLAVSGLVLADSSRSKAMRLYFDAELRSITAKFIERLNNNDTASRDGTTRSVLLDRFREHNKTKLAATIVSAKKLKQQTALLPNAPSTQQKVTNMKSSASGEAAASEKLPPLKSAMGNSQQQGAHKKSHSSVSAVRFSEIHEPAVVTAPLVPVGGKRGGAAEDLANKTLSKKSSSESRNSRGAQYEESAEAAAARHNKKNYRFPAQINFRAMDWLFDDQAD